MDIGHTSDGTPGDTSAEWDNACADVAMVLWHERELLERLLFTLTSQQLILAAGEIRWLPAADEQVQQAVDALTDCELHRAIETSRLATLLELSESASLDDLVRATDAPWDSLLGDHRDTLRELVGEITAATAENRRLLRAGADTACETLARVGSATSGYGDGGCGCGSIGRPVLLDRQA
jgi:hypothetical protein